MKLFPDYGAYALGVLALMPFILAILVCVYFGLGSGP